MILLLIAIGAAVITALTVHALQERVEQSTYNKHRND